MTVSEVRIELSNLQDECVDLRGRLEQLIESGENPDSIILLQKAINQNSVRQYAAKSKILRLSRLQVQEDRETAISDRDRLEAELKRAALFYEQKLREAEDARVQYQTIGLKLGSLDSRIETNRELLNERQQEIGRHIARWKENAYSQLTADSVCDY